MFTGLIEEIGIIKSVAVIGNNRRLKVQASKIVSDVNIDDSVSINGACQTVIKHDANSFEVVAVQETLLKTTLGNFKVGSVVNLERAMRLGDRLGGHLVQGHVDCVGRIIKIEPASGSWQVWVEFPSGYSQYVIPVGSVCIDGISLTVARVEKNRLMVAIIPHTFEFTTLQKTRTGDFVNIEFDILGKYIEKMFLTHQKNNTEKSVLDSWVSQPDI